jgi:hypothetical protein
MAEHSVGVFYVHVSVHRNKFLFNKTNRRTNFPSLFLSRNSRIKVTWNLESPTEFLLIKSTNALISQVYFCQETLHVSGSSIVHHQEFYTVNSALVYVMYVWWQLSSTTRMTVLGSCHQICMTYTSTECIVENSWWWAEELSEMCRVSWQK